MNWPDFLFWTGISCQRPPQTLAAESHILFYSGSLMSGPIETCEPVRGLWLNCGNLVLCAAWPHSNHTDSTNTLKAHHIINHFPLRRSIYIPSFLSGCWSRLLKASGYLRRRHQANNQHSVPARTLDGLWKFPRVVFALRKDARRRARFRWNSWTASGLY